MKPILSHKPSRWVWFCLPCFLLVLARVAADQVDMQNGDRYVGKVLSLDHETLVLQNELLGTVKLPRARVAAITLGNVQKPPMTVSRSQTNAVADPTGLIAKLSANSNLIDHVQKQFLAGAGAEAQGKFNELVSGLLSGKLTVEDVRAQARATAEQVRAHRNDLGESAGWALDGYLAILDQFLGESPPSKPSGTAPRAPNVKDSPED